MYLLRTENNKNTQRAHGCYVYDIIQFTKPKPWLTYGQRQIDLRFKSFDILRFLLFFFFLVLL